MLFRSAGFSWLIRSSGIPVSGAKALVFGNGGAAPAVCLALRRHGALPVVISRSGPDHYGNLSRHRDAEILVNTTPLGMYPENGRAPVDLRDFPACRGVFDIIYNPARTALLLQAEELGIPSANGLPMLVAQACRSSECFTGGHIPDEIGRAHV